MYFVKHIQVVKTVFSLFQAMTCHTNPEITLKATAI